MGSRTERQLVNTIEDETDLVANRIDFGGGGGFHSPHDMGDIIAGRAIDATPENGDEIQTLTDLYLIEEKYKATDANPYLQEKSEKIDPFVQFSLAIGATPVLAVRWSSNLDWSPGAQHLLKNAMEVRCTDAGNWSVKPEEAEESFVPVTTFF